MIISVTLSHDAYLSTSPDAAAMFTNSSLNHWSRATTLFNRVLSGPIPPEARDALWATAALIGANVFASVEPTKAEDAWPLKPSDPHDLNWLKLSDGKKVIWEIANPLRPDSVFSKVAKIHNFTLMPPWVKDNNFSNICAEVLALFDITPFSTATNNPYHMPLLFLSHLQPIMPTRDNTHSFLLFMGYMPSEYCKLLEAKDPRAMLLLCWWFQRVAHSEVWWLQSRGRIEGEGIKIWLRKYCGGEDGLARLIDVYGERVETSVIQEEGFVGKWWDDRPDIAWKR
jgi:hypothetical protein